MAKKSSRPDSSFHTGPLPDAGADASLMNAYFLSLSLENVRCFGPLQTLDLSNGEGGPAPWTIILGLNGTGKTTILQSLTGFERLEPSEVNSANCPRFFSLFPNPFFAGFHRRTEKSAELTAGFCVSNELVSSPTQSGLAKIEAYYNKYGQSSGSFMPFGDSSPWCCAYGVSRRFGASALSDSSSDDSTASLFSDKAELRNPEEWLLRLDYSAAKESDIQDQQKLRLDQTRELLLGILPDIDDIRFTTQNRRFPTPRVEFKTPYGWVPLRQLGYGYQTLITWVADLASRMVERYPDSNNPLAEPAVVLVDEIDLHLHPIWQRKLMGFLTERFPNTQFIATAHSPLMAQAAGDANLAVLRREGDHVVIDNDVDNIRNWRVDQILTSDLFGLETTRPPQIEKLLAERKALLTSVSLTKAKKQRLRELEGLIGDLPTGATAQEIKDREEIRRTLELLKAEKGL